VSVTQSLPEASPLLAGIQKQLLSAQFLLLRRLLMTSARHNFADCHPRSQLERRILLMLFRTAECRVSELAFGLGIDVSQISRALAELRKAGLVERDRQRDPYVLTIAGEAAGRALCEVAIQREELLTRGLTASQMFDLAGLLMIIHIRASHLLDEELGIVRQMGTATEGFLPQSSNFAPSIIINIANTIARDATAVFKRLAGASNFEWRVLVQVASRPSITFTNLVDHIDADKAQVSRTVDDLVTAGLLERVKAAGEGLFGIELTGPGHDQYILMRDHALQRDDQITAGLQKGQIARLRSYLRVLLANAQQMCGDA
jgi:DNA-binding MarR family transcriptional regulator